ncbi:hypothetical protein QDR37_14350 [Amnibacterium sp. CER49]|uniref:hypothetical protein n=1 Tax=Amnibacterium sp. CER49 TaxID=3039161 RepID=UPI00244B208A|nr:hypothetical protein [Amnibacterium sp. CER49]MDH2445131.1 hypothetical protein [Amnibacterium sp. CER49]
MNYPFQKTRTFMADSLLLRQYGLDKFERLEMLVWGLVLTQVAIPIGSAIYFLTTQTRYMVGFQGKIYTVLYLKDAWDRLPIHIEDLFGARWFGPSQKAPAWWVIARHDARHVLIGFIAVLLVGAITVGFKNRERASRAHMVLSIPLAFLAALATAGVLIAFFIYAAPAVDSLGTTSGNPYLQNLVGKGTIQLTIIGVAAGFAAKAVLKRTFDTLQLMSLERNLAQGAQERWWWKLVYPPNYRKRFEYLQASGDRGSQHSRWLGAVLATSAPILTLLLVFGVWVLYFGPAAHAA